MAYIKERIFGGQHFCCCLPVRLGIILISFVSILLSGALTLLCWFELTHSYDMSSKEKAAFAATAIVEVCLFLTSITGFTGAIINKLMLVTIFMIFIYGHFFVNIAIAAYLLWTITHASNTDIVSACHGGLQNVDSQGQCTSLLKVAKAVYFVIASVILLIEMYAAIVVTRYTRHLRKEKQLSQQNQRNRTTFPLVKHVSHCSEDIALLQQAIHQDMSVGVDNISGGSNNFRKSLNVCQVLDGFQYMHLQERREYNPQGMFAPLDTAEAGSPHALLDSSPFSALPPINNARGTRPLNRQPLVDDLPTYPHRR